MRAVALQRLMGHTDINITLNTYTTVFNKYKEEELKKVNEYYLNNEIFDDNLLLNIPKSHLIYSDEIDK